MAGNDSKQLTNQIRRDRFDHDEMTQEQIA